MGKFRCHCVLFVVLSISLATSVKPNVVSSEMDKEKVVPDVIDTAPEDVLIVEYGSNEVNLGNVLTPIQVKDQPNVIWNADSNKFYLLCMTDPDVPSRVDSKRRVWQHWLVGNIPGSDMSQGEVLFEYVGSGPQNGTGLHRYIFLVYEQPKKLTFDEQLLTSPNLEHRGSFTVRDLEKKYTLGQPIAGNFYQAQWDEYVPKLYQELLAKFSGKGK